ncbi:MAG: PPC domain-containing protein, partial [Chitinophagaceae bacterium]
MKASQMFYKLICLVLLYSPLLTDGQSNSRSNAIMMGNYSSGPFSFSDSRNNSGYGNEYTTPGDPFFGQPSEDIFYRFTLKGTAEVSISTCGPDFDTYIHLLNSDGSPLAHNDNNGVICAGSSASLQATLAAGEYYLVLEGYGSGRGQINTLVNLVVPAPSVLTPTSSRNFIRVWEATAPQG